MSKELNKDLFKLHTEEVDAKLVENLDQESVSFWKKSFKKFVKHKPSIFWTFVLLVLISLSIFVPMFSKYGVNQQNLTDVNLAPNANHWFGTDANGQDLFVRVWFGLGVSLLIGLFVTTLSFIIGLPLGLIQGYFGGKIDDIILGIENILQSIPDIILFLVLLLALGRGPSTFVLALSIYMWIDTAINARANAIQQKNLEYVLVAKTLGTSNIKIIFKHIFPNIISRQIIVVSSLIPLAIMYEAFLSFLGIGMDSTRITSLGGLLSKTSELIFTYPYQVFIPATVLIILIFSINFIAMGLQYAFDEKL